MNEIIISSSIFITAAGGLPTSWSAILNETTVFTNGTFGGRGFNQNSFFFDIWKNRIYGMVRDLLTNEFCLWNPEIWFLVNKENWIINIPTFSCFLVLNSGLRILCHATKFRVRFRNLNFRANKVFLCTSLGQDL